MDKKYPDQIFIPYIDLNENAMVEKSTRIMADLEETRASIEGAREVSKEIPILVTMTFGPYGRTMMGVSPEEAVLTLSSLEVSAVGASCGEGPQQIISILKEMRKTAPGATLVAKANAGMPEVVAGKTLYTSSLDAMVTYALEAHAAGARNIGGCCGSTPSHIKAMGEALLRNQGGGRSTEFIHHLSESDT